MTQLAGEVREGSSLETASPEVQPENAQRVRSVALPSTPMRESVTQRVRRAGEVASILGALANKPGTVLHSQPPTFWQAWDRHRECAGHFSSPLLRWLRLTFGCLHLLAVLAPLYLLFWVTESPLRLLVAAVLVAAIWFWS